MRRDEHEAAHAMILDIARVDRRDRGAIGMPEKEATAKADPLQELREHVERLVMHVAQLARQLDGARCAIAGARIGKDAGSGRRRQRIGEIAPEADRAQALMKHDDGRGLARIGADMAIFETALTDIEHAGSFKRHHNVRRASLCRPRSPQGAKGDGWWAWQDSNLQPDRYERPALTIELQALEAGSLPYHAPRQISWNKSPANRRRRSRHPGSKAS